MSKLPASIQQELAENYISVDELAAMTGKNARILRREITNGTLNAVKVDRGYRGRSFKYYIAKSDARDFLEFRGSTVPPQLIGQLTRDYKVTVQERLDRDPEFRQALETEFATDKVRPETLFERVCRYFFTLTLAFMGKI